jgi:hypothetical protein
MFKAPRQLPPLEVLLRDLGSPPAGLTARALGVSERTVYGWQATGEAPRPAALALFWETSWGRSVANAESVNGERWARGQVNALEREAATLRARVAYLERVGQFGCSNAPSFQSSSPLAVLTIGIS